jgi:hypothetical protein
MRNDCALCLGCCTGWCSRQIQTLLITITRIPILNRFQIGRVCTLPDRRRTYLFYVSCALVQEGYKPRIGAETGGRVAAMLGGVQAPCTSKSLEHLEAQAGRIEVKGTIRPSAAARALTRGTKRKIRRIGVVILLNNGPRRINRSRCR